MDARVIVRKRSPPSMSGSVHISFGSWLKERRREAGISQDELAGQIDCAPITLQKIVSGKRRPSRQIALLLAAYFGVPEDEHEAFVTFARAHIPTPGISSPTSPTSLTAKPGDLTDLTTEAQTNSSQNAPWRAVHLSKSNLPLVLTTLIGREHELDELCTRLRQPKVRLLTLTGSPGTGKTRLSIEVAASLLGDFEDGVYLVELAPLSDPAMVIPSIARTLDLRETGAQSIEETLLAHIKDKRILLVLDNFEHLLDAGPQVVKLIQASPWVKVLITSREALHVRGERQYPLHPLSLPLLANKPGRPSLEELARNPAVQLFVERAQSVDMDFALTEENALEVAEVCVNLDGLPLAIELAAGRVSLFPPRTLLSRLGQQLKVLTGGSRDLPPRQQTLRGAIEWSYDLLDEGHGELFRRMAVFWGGQTLQGLEAVCNSDSLQAKEKKLKVEVLDGVETLLSSNLLQQREGRDGEPRFWMLETIHEYAREKLEESGEAQILQREHALYFMRLAEEAEPHLTGRQQEEWLERLEDEYDNLRTALAWARAIGGGGEPGGENRDNEAVVVGLRIAGALWRFWNVRGYLSEGREQLAGMLGLSAPSTVSTMEALPSQSQTRSQSQSRHSYRARALNGAGNVASSQGDYAGARSLHEESLAISREIGDKLGIAASLNGAGNVARSQGDYAGARSLHEESLSIRRELGDKGGIANSLSSLGIVAYSQGDYATARSLHEESLALRKEIGDKRGIAYSLSNLGNVASSQGDYAGARSLHEESLSIRRELGDKRGIAISLAGLGGVVARIGQALVHMSEQTQEAMRGARLLGAAEALLEAMSATLEPDDRTVYEQGVASARAQLGEEAFEEAMQEGRGMSLDQAIEYSLQEIGDE
jgi:predicted ATPase/transcriptional regulator with XRE-family HTH domain